MYSLDKYAVDLTVDHLLVRDMVKIFETRKVKWGILKARNPINMARLRDSSLMDTSFDYTGGDVENEPLDAWSSSDYRRGFGSFKYPELRGATYDVWAALIVMEICRQK